jgi:hypothetical protein
MIECGVGTPLPKRKRNKPMKKLQVSLPDDLREKLDAAVAESGNSLGEEIRQRLERTLEQDARSASDPITDELVRGVINLAADVERDFGASWYGYEEAHNIFVAAVAARLAAFKPPAASLLSQLITGFGEQVAGQMQQAPDALGAMLERADRRSHSYEHLARLQAAKGVPNVGTPDRVGILQKKEEAPRPRLRKPKGE